MKTYRQIRTCAECGKDEWRIVPLAFGGLEKTVAKWIDPCGNCGSETFSSTSMVLEEEREMLERWIHDADFQLIPQDEELILGVGENLDLLEHFLLRRDALPQKRQVLLAAICVVIYDNTPSVYDEPVDFINPEFADKAAEILKRNADVFDEVNGDFVYEYIRKVAYPAIGRPFVPDGELD